MDQNIFMPKRLRDWKPEHMRCVPRRRCHWCTSGPHRMGELIVVLESPMRYHFCKDVCMEQWRQHRHDEHVLEWLKQGAGTRAKILKSYRNANQTPTANVGGSGPDVCCSGDNELSVREGQSLPLASLCSECGTSDEHRGV